MFSRRTFVSGSAIAALTTGSSACKRTVARAPRGPSPIEGKASEIQRRRYEALIARALEVAKKEGATYADVRVHRRRTEGIGTREDHVVSVTYGETFGVGVRVLVAGAWGFASTPLLEAADVEEAARKAVAIAKAASTALERPVQLVPAPVSTGTWRTPMRIDPFEVPLAEKAQYLLDLWAQVKDVPKVKYATGSFEALAEWKLFGSSEGTLIEQEQTRLLPALTVTALDKGEFESRRSEVPPMQAGWEYVTGSPLKSLARELAEDAKTKLGSPSVTAGKRDLVLAPSNLWLTIHESVGHPTELDRALGLEANLAGTSFATPDKRGKLRYGSEIVTLYGDKTTPGGLASCKWDDDGVPTQRWDLVKDGLFVGWQTTRDQAAWIGETESRGTSYAMDHASVAFQRMPNVSLAPSSSPKTLEEMISATDDGILITGDGSWSIDHQRYNFQFSGQMFHAIKGGKIAGTLRDVAYQSSSLEFWRSCDMIGGADAWTLHGTLWDGKGEPGQANAVSHGCPPARFRGVNVVNVDKRKRT